MVVRIVAAIVLAFMGVAFVSRLVWGTGRRRYFDVAGFAVLCVAAFAGSNLTSIILLTTSLLLSVLIGAVFWLWRIGGVERYFWAAAISYFLYEDLAAREAAALAFQFISIRSLREKIHAALQVLSSTPGLVVLLIIQADATHTAEARSQGTDQATLIIQRRALDVLTSIADPLADSRRLRAELRTLSPDYEAALFAFVPRPEIFFGRLDGEIVKQVDALFTS